MRFRTPVALILMWVLVSACNFPTGATQSPPGVDNAVGTAAAQTVAAELTLALSAQPASETAAPQPATETPAGAQPTATLTPAPSATPLPSATTTEVPCDRAGFVRDVTIPDGTVLAPGDSFRKTWRLENTGTCTWDNAYTLVFVEGDALGGPASAPLTTGTVAPGEEIDISVDLTAPLDPGEYRGNWKLRNASGVLFGLGSDAEAQFWVEIEVQAPTATPNPGANLYYEEVHPCSGTAHAIFRVDNVGNVNLESARITVTDLSGGTLSGPVTSNAPFMGSPGECPPGGKIVPAGKTRYVGGSLSAAPPSGNTARATVRLCSQDDLEGACIDRSVDFNIP